MKRIFATATLFGLLAVLMMSSCASEPKQQTAGKPDASPMTQATTQGSGATGSVAGVEWKVPSGWSVGAQKPMRAATYLIGSGDAQAECAVFYFGKGQGGDLEANIERWISQVKQPDGSDSKDKAVRDEIVSSCCKITTIEVAGTYQASSGPMMQVTAEKPGFVLLGGIVPGDEGNVFFKFTGPAELVKNSKGAFLGMLSSVSKRSN